MNTKKEIRKKLLRKRNILTKEECRKYSKLIETQLFLSEQYIKTDTLLIYASYQKEVYTHDIIKKALNAGKKVFCPKVLSPGIMKFYEITSFEDVVLGYKNIPEPRRNDSVFSFSNNNIKNSCIIMPLVGFDAEKNRLGYGGGFYDRYLQNFPDIARIGIAFECQRYEGIIPAEETDIKPNFIITEVNIY